jgi:5'(3')-deoxyribonucleotidase
MTLTNNSRGYALTQKPKLGIDVDDVVVDYVRGLLEFYNHTHFDRVRYEQIKDFKLQRTFSKTPTFESVMALMAHFSHHDYFRKLPAVPNAIPGLRQLDLKYDVHLITARDERTAEDTFGWFHSNGYFPKNIHFTKDKGLKAKELGLVAHVDDAIHNLDNIVQHSPDTKPILYHRPWNAHSHSYDRVHHWQGLIEKLK